MSSYAYTNNFENKNENNKTNIAISNNRMVIAATIASSEPTNKQTAITKARTICISCMAEFARGPSFTPLGTMFGKKHFLFNSVP